MTRFFARLVTIVAVAALPGAALASAFDDAVRGRILLDVEQNGEAWYVYPETDERYYLSRPDDAFAVMHTLGLGITNADLEQIPVSTSTAAGNAALRSRLSGMILLQVEEHGEAWYVYPGDLRRYYLGRPADAFALMTSLGLGISSADLARIPIASASLDLPSDETSEYRSYTLSIARGSFAVRVISLRRDAFEMVTDTADTEDCGADCNAKPLAEFVAENQGFAAIHGTYFCPPDYASCEGQVNTYLPPVYNSELGIMINEDRMKVYRRPMIAQTTDDRLWYFHRADDDFGDSVVEFEEAEDVVLSAAIGNWPSLIENGEVVVEDEPSESGFLTKATRGGIGWDADTVFLVVASSATVEDLAYIFEGLGADNAMNLDGGGSAALYYDGAYKAGPGRLLPNAIVFRKK